MQWSDVFLPEFLVEDLTVGSDILKMFSCDILENVTFFNGLIKFRFVDNMTKYASVRLLCISPG